MASGMGLGNADQKLEWTGWDTDRNTEKGESGAVLSVVSLSSPPHSSPGLGNNRQDHSERIYPRFYVHAGTQLWEFI